MTTARPVAIARRHPRLCLDPRAVARVIHTLDEHHATLATRRSTLGHHGELSLVFLTDSALAKLHQQFLNDPTITDVMTFEGDVAFGSAGEICVSVDAALRHVTDAGTAPTHPSTRRRRRVGGAAFARELTLYLVHGWLHLAGYDDLQPAKKRVMRRAEARAMALLDRAGAVPAFQLGTRARRRRKLAAVTRRTA